MREGSLRGAPVYRRLDVVQEVLGLLVGEVDLLSAEQLKHDRSVCLVDREGADVIQADAALLVAGVILEQKEIHGGSPGTGAEVHKGHPDGPVERRWDSIATAA